MTTTARRTTGGYSTSANTPFAVIDDEDGKQYINSVAVTRLGAFLISVTCGGTGVHFVYTRRSEDRGCTWGERVIAYDARALGPEFDCEMGQLAPTPGGRIYQFHIIRDRRRSNRFGRLAYTISEDDGQSWRGPDGPGSTYSVETLSYALAPDGYGWHLMAPPRVLQNGEWVLPLNVATDPPALADIRSEIVVMRSPNLLTERYPAALAFTFTPSPPHGVPVPLDAVLGASLGQEPQLAELADGRWFVVARTGNGTIAYTLSANRGATWTAAETLRDTPGGAAFRHPNAPCPLTPLGDGRYALLFCDNDGSGGGGRDPFDHTRNRNPIYVSVGREIPGWAAGEQPLDFGPPRLLCEIETFRPGTGWRDLTYGQLVVDGGDYFHFYNALWQSVQVNRVNPALLDGATDAPT